MNRKKQRFTVAASLATISLCLALLVSPLQGQVGKVYAQGQVGHITLTQPHTNTSPLLASGGGWNKG